MAPSDAPIIVIVPGAAQKPAHYAYLQHLLHLLHQKGYPTLSVPLPSTGPVGPVTVQDDADFVRSRLLLPVLDIENHNVITVSHSYSGIPTTAAAHGPC